MLDVCDRETSTFKKSDLKTQGIPVDGIPGLFRAERFPWSRAMARFDRDTKERYSHDEIYKRCWNINDYFDVPVNYAYEYVSNVYSLEEWSYGIRDLKYVGNSIYQGCEHWVNGTDVFVKSRSYSQAHAVDYYYAWDQKKELWVRYYFRFLDAKPIIDRPGTILSWFSLKHPYHDKSSPRLPDWVKNAQNRNDRQWLGDYWRYFYAWHKVETDNLRYILECRYHKRNN
jgi:hypothetical protein